MREILWNTSPFSLTFSGYILCAFCLNYFPQTRAPSRHTAEFSFIVTWHALFTKHWVVLFLLLLGDFYYHKGNMWQSQIVRSSTRWNTACQHGYPASAPPDGTVKLTLTSPLPVPLEIPASTKQDEISALVNQYFLQNLPFRFYSISFENIRLWLMKSDCKNHPN